MRRGTTPTLRVTTTIDISQWARVIVTLKGDKQIDIEKDRLVFDENNPKRFWFTLTQKETLDVGALAEMQIRILSSDGVARASDIKTLRFGRILKWGVLNV